MKSTMMQTPLSINDILAHGVRLFPQRQIVSRLPDKSVRRHSFAEFHQRALSLASALTQLGLAKGDRVATLCWNHHAHLEAYFGIPAAGGVMHTLNLRLAPQELGWIAADAQDRFLVVDDILLPLYREFAHLHQFERVIVVPFSGAPVAAHARPADGPGFDDYEALLRHAPAGFEPVLHGEDDAIAMCYTSGTTGNPKGVVYSHRSTVLHSLVLALPDVMGFSAADVILPVTPMFHANCWGVPYAAVMLGASLVFPGPHLHAEDLLDLMQDERPTVVLGVPTVWLGIVQLCKSQPNRWTLPAGMRGPSGGSSVPEALIRALAELGIELRQGWGMTETSPLGSMFFEKPELQHELTASDWYARRAMAGIPAPLVRLRVVDESGKECAWDGESVGELQARGPYVTGSYYGVAPSDEKFTSDGWLRTGDLASIDPHGYLKIADRLKDLIKSGGEWISSVDLENAIMAHPAVAEAAVIALAHDRWGERPLACVVIKPGAHVEAEELHQFIGQKFARWQLPDAFEFVDAIPRTSTGKFWKLKLRERYAGWQWPRQASA
jgi:fatty-acyl-CoA synthase